MKSLDEMRAQLVEKASLWGNALSTGDSRTANRLNRQIGRIIETYRDDKEQSESLLVPLFGHSSPSVRLMASVWALEFQLHTQEAEAVLSGVESDPAAGIVRSMAFINISKWRDKKAGKPGA